MDQFFNPALRIRIEGLLPFLLQVGYYIRPQRSNLLNNVCDNLIIIIVKERNERF
jgi:hypothetical protein